MSKIFVSVVSYRDPLLEKTVRNLFDTVSPYSQLTVGVFEQTCLEESLQTKAADLVERNDVRYKRIDPEHVMGVGWARYNNALQMKDEDYFYQVDSHTQFDQNWDRKLLEDFSLASAKHGGSNKIIISTACKNFEVKGGEIILHNIPPMTAKVRYFDYDKNLDLLGAHGDWIDATDDVVPAIHTCAGNLFTHSCWVHEIGPDARMYFTGEEQKIVLSSFLAGYHIYQPREMVSYHFLGSNDYVTKVWKDPVIKERVYSEDVNKSFDYWKRYLKSISREDLQRFYEYSGVDYINQKLDERARTYSIRVMTEEEKIANAPKVTPWGTAIEQPSTLERPYMPGSVGKFDELMMIHELPHIAPTSVLDVGAGMGRMGSMIKSTFPECRLTALEPTESYIRDYHLDQKYDEVVHSTIQDYLRTEFGIYDVVLCIDVLEHLFLSEAIDVIEALTYHSRWIIAVWPNDVNQQHALGNPYEKHKSNMQLSDLQRFDVHHYKKIRLEDNTRQNYNYALIAGIHSPTYK